MKLKLNGLEVLCVIGERPDERTRLQKLVVGLELEVADRAAETDELADAVDYAALAERVRAVLVAAKCRMIERAAFLVYGLCMATSGVKSARVSVIKSGAVAGLSSAEVVYDGR